MHTTLKTVENLCNTSIIYWYTHTYIHLIKLESSSKTKEIKKIFWNWIKLESSSKTKEMKKIFWIWINDIIYTQPSQFCKNQLKKYMKIGYKIRFR